METLWGQIIGGIGLFLLGIEFTRTGFREAAGNSLRRILAGFAGTSFKAVFSGFLVSSLVQSASAVTLTVIGFLNAGILHLKQAVMIVLGSNLGKITSAWLICTLGLKLNISNYALPMVGVGLFLKMILKKKYQGIGYALVGFSLLFLGIHFLKESVGTVSSTFDLSPYLIPGTIGILSLFGWGFIMTVITQSSSAALTIVLSMATAKMVNLEQAMALMVGLNLGTTMNAYVYSMRASLHAKRLAIAHILFNWLSSVVGLAFIFTLIHRPELHFLWEKIEHDPIIGLVSFYTSFLLVSALLVLPVSRYFVKWLKKRFQEVKALGTPHFITPHRFPQDSSVAIGLIEKEASRFAKISLGMLRDSLNWHSKGGWIYAEDLSQAEWELDQLSESIHEFSSYYTTQEDCKESKRIFDLVRAVQHFSRSSDLSYHMSKDKRRLVEPLSNELLDELNEWSKNLDALVKEIKDAINDRDVKSLQEVEKEILVADVYRRKLRAHLIEMGIYGELKSEPSHALVDIIEASRRSFQELLRGAVRLIESSENQSEISQSGEAAQLLDFPKQ